MPLPPLLPESPQNPRGWTYLNSSHEDRDMGEVEGKHLVGHFVFDNYFMVHEGKMCLLQMQCN